MPEFKGRITRQSFYSKNARPVTTDVLIIADTVEEAANIIHNRAVRLEIMSSTSMVQRVVIKIGDVWKDVEEFRTK